MLDRCYFVVHGRTLFPCTVEKRTPKATCLHRICTLTDSESAWNTMKDDLQNDKMEAPWATPKCP